MGDAAWWSVHPLTSDGRAMLLLWAGSRRHDTSAVYHHIIILSFVGCQMRELKKKKKRKTTIVLCIIDSPLLALSPGLWICHTHQLPANERIAKLLLPITRPYRRGETSDGWQGDADPSFFNLWSLLALPPQETRPRTNSYNLCTHVLYTPSRAQSKVYGISPSVPARPITICDGLKIWPLLFMGRLSPFLFWFRH